MAHRCLDSVPDIHSCINLMLENAQLKRKLLRLRHENSTLTEQLTGERQKTQAFMCRGVGFHKLLSMHNALSRRYEKELRTGMQQVELTTELQLKVNSLEQKLKEASLHKQEADSRRRYKRVSSARGDGASDSDEECELYRLKNNVRKLKKERNKLFDENKKIKSEVQGLDAGFFEEVEDLKYALQQSAQLNKRYEHSLRRVCAKFGLPYPNPEKSLDNFIA